MRKIINTTCALLLCTFHSIGAAGAEDVYITIVHQTKNPSEMDIPIDAKTTPELFQGVQEAKADVLIYTLVKHVTNKKVLTLSSDMLSSHDGTLNDQGTDCSFSVSATDESVAIGGLCTVNTVVNGKAVDATHAFPPTESTVGNGWLLLSYDEATGVGIYAKTETH